MAQKKLDPSTSCSLKRLHNFYLFLSPNPLNLHTKKKFRENFWSNKSENDIHEVKVSKFSKTFTNPDLNLVPDITLIISLDSPHSQKTSITFCNLSNKTIPVSSTDHDYSFSIT